ncbi:MAG: FtsX-like permease family protein [Alkalibacterium sp.]|nr:FtsX-like permease family protein [Alkalibacterium sp.]
MRLKALRKDTIREIWRTKTRFLSIFAIILLGVAFFAGLSATGPVMINTAGEYYSDQNLSDLHVFSTMGLEDEDIALLNSIEDAILHPTYSVDVIFEETGSSSKVMGLPDQDAGINQLVVTEGRLPEQIDEIALDYTQNYINEYDIGDTIQIEEGTPDEFEESFVQTRFEVVGFVNHPQYIENGGRGNTQVGTGTLEGFSVVLEDAFDMDVYTDAYLLFENARAFDVYSQDYRNYIDERTTEVESLLADRSVERYEELYEEIEAEIEDGYDDIEEARQELADAETELEEARVEIDEGFEEYEAGLTELEQEEAEARNEINNQRNQLLNAQSELEDTRSQLEAAQIEDPQTWAEIEAQELQIEQGLAEVSQAETELDNSIQDAQAELETARIELEEAEAEYEEGLAEFEDERETANEEIEEALVDLEEAEEALADLEEPDYYVQDRTDLQGYSEFEENAERISSIAQIFPVFFFLLAALISLTTMTRMVDEGRNQMGTLKALGYGNFAIAAKYFVYAFIATVAGGIIGVFLGYWIFPNVIIDAYSSLYNLPPAQTGFYWNYAVISILGALLATGLSTVVSVRLSLRSNSADLLRPKAPKKGKRIFLEYVPFIWNRFTFTQKVASRNLFRYKRRMLMTLFGVAGGTALLLTGYGLSDSIADIGDIQFGEINLYQAIISENTDASDTQMNEYNETLESIDGYEGDLSILQENATAETGESSQEVNVFVPSEPDRLNDFVVLRDVDDESRVLELPSEGAIITDKLADLLNSEAGDVISVEPNDSESFEVEIVEVVEHYLQHYIYLAPEVYTDLTGNEAEFNTRLLTYDTELVDDDELGQLLTSQDAVQGVAFAGSIQDTFQDSMDSLDVVTLVLIVSAASLAFVVLYNLTNINVSERVRELSTIKVLGFFDKEVTLYVYRENFVLTVLGILVGFVLGFIMHRFVLETAEIDIMRFSRQISMNSYLYSFLLMFFFSSLVMVVMHFKLKRIDMVEALKTQD